MIGSYRFKILMITLLSLSALNLLLNPGKISLQPRCHIIALTINGSLEMSITTLLNARWKNLDVVTLGMPMIPSTCTKPLWGRFINLNT